MRHKSLIRIVFLDFKRCMYPHGYPQMAPATPRALRSGDCYGYSQLGAWRGCPHGARDLRATPLTRARPRRISGQQPLAHCRPSTRLAGSHNVTLCDASTSPPALARVRDAAGNPLPRARGTLRADGRTLSDFPHPSARGSPTATLTAAGHPVRAGNVQRRKVIHVHAGRRDSEPASASAATGLLSAIGKVGPGAPPTPARALYFPLL